MEEYIDMDEDSFRRVMIIAHYRHEHTKYDLEKRDVEKRLDPDELNEWNKLISRYKSRKYARKRDAYLDEIRRLKIRLLKGPENIIIESLWRWLSRIN